MTPLPNNTTCSRKETNGENLPDEILQAREEALCTIFVVGIWSFRPEEIGMKENLPYYRQMFEENNAGHKSMLQTKWQPCDVNSNVVRIAIHIPRGDFISCLKGNSINTEQRLVDENAYAMVLNQVIKKLEGFGVRHVEVRLYCEGMDAPSKIPSAISWELVDSECHCFPWFVGLH